MNLKMLAAHLGLSQTTVSRALNGYPEVAEATRRKVLEAAQAHNYRPNARAKSLATGRSMAIGHVGTRAMVVQHPPWAASAWCVCAVLQRSHVQTQGSLPDFGSLVDQFKTQDIQPV